MNESAGEHLKRRDFFQLALGWCTALFALGASAAATARFIFPNVLYEPDRRYKALKPDDYPEGATFLPEIRVFVLRRGNRFRAVSAVCTHLSCTVNRPANQQGFHCPCHGTYFDDNGTVLNGPAPQPLPWYEVTLSRDGRLVLDTSRPVAADRYLVV